MDIALKQRLVGASVLIALAVVVLPMLFGGRPDSGSPGSTRIEIDTDREEGQFETRRFPIGEAPVPDDAPAGEPPKLELPSPARTVAVEPPDPGASAPGAATVNDAGPPASGDGAPPEAEPDLENGVAAAAPEPETEAAAPAAPVTAPPSTPVAVPASQAGGQYVVQVASFGSVNNASKLSARLRGLGYAVMNDTVSSDVGTLNRVRVGPYGSESEAERAVAQLRQQVDGSKPRVINLQPGRAERVTDPADALVRWVVQVGSFSSAANADNLVAKLRLEGHSAYREQVSSSGSTIYRVRVGPFVDREEAIGADRRINERLSLDGVVMSAD